MGRNDDDENTFHGVSSNSDTLRRGICPLLNTKDTGSARNLLNIFNSERTAFVPRDVMADGYTNLKKCIGPYCPRASKPDFLTDLIFPADGTIGQSNKNSVFQPTFSLSQRDFLKRVNNLNDSTLIPGCERHLTIQTSPTAASTTSSTVESRNLRMITDEGEVRVIVVGNSSGLKKLKLHENSSKDDDDYYSSVKSFKDFTKLNGLRFLKKDIDVLQAQLKVKYGDLNNKDDVYATIDIVPSPGIPPIRWIYSTRRLYLLIRPEFASFLTMGMLVPKEVLHFRVHLINDRCEDVSAAAPNGGGDNSPNQRDLPQSEIYPQNDDSLVTSELLEEIYGRLWPLIVPWPQKTIRGDLVASFFNVSNREGAFVSFSKLSDGYRAQLFTPRTGQMVFTMALISLAAAFVAGIIIMQILLRVCSKFISKHNSTMEVKKRLDILERSMKAECRKRNEPGKLNNNGDGGEDGGEDDEKTITFDAMIDTVEKNKDRVMFLYLDIDLDTFGILNILSKGKSTVNLLLL